jgi:hypothetical protein
MGDQTVRQASLGFPVEEVLQLVPAPAETGQRPFLEHRQEVMLQAVHVRCRRGPLPLSSVERQINLPHERAKLYVRRWLIAPGVDRPQNLGEPLFGITLSGLLYWT